MAVLTKSQPRPDLQAYRESATLPFPGIVKGLAQMLGKKLTAYIAGVKDVRAIDRWIDGSEPYKGAETKLRLAYHISKVLSEYEGHKVVQAWLTGLNPELDDRAPIRMLREGDPEEIGPQVLGAVRAFLAGG